MKITHSQRGSSRLVISIVLVVALLGVLSFIFWQNVVNQTSNEAEDTQNTSQNSDISQLQPTYLALTDIGIRIPYVSSEDSYTASQPIDSGLVSVYSASAAEAGCTYSEGSEPAGFIGGIIALPVTDNQTEASEFVRVVTKDETAYILSSPQNACDAAEAQEAAFLRFADQFEKLEVL